MNIQIGNLIKATRKKNKITLNDLADKTGLSVSYLSLMERGLNSPTLENLQKVCLALNLTLSDLITQAESVSTVVVKPDERTTMFNDEGYLYQTAFSSEHKMSCIFMTVTNDELHVSEAHVNDEIGYIVKGSMVFDIGGVSYEVHPGDCIYIEAGKKHAYRKTSVEESVTIWFNISGDVRI